jgi:5-formyltetrahydrofolate cyclo-ligase
VRIAQKMGNCAVMGDSLPKQKAELRTRVRQALRALEPAERAAESMAIRTAIRSWPMWSRSTCVMGFLPLASEVDVRPLLAEAMQRGVRVAVPLAGPHGLFEPCLLESLDPGDLELDAMGVQVPRRQVPVATEALQVVLVPAMAFDPQGRRLGRGGGYYDRFLPRLARSAASVGVCHGVQRVPMVPCAAHDHRVEWIATASDVVAAQPLEPM